MVAQTTQGKGRKTKKGKVISMVVHNHIVLLTRAVECVNRQKEARRRYEEEKGVSEAEPEGLESLH